MRVELVFAKPTVGGRLLVDSDVKHNWRAHDLDTLPRWIQERVAMLRLLDDAEVSPLGAWYAPSSKPDGAILIAIVRLPGDPEWEK